MNQKNHILFLCVANSARSQIAEALARKILGSTVVVASAGSRPSGKIHTGAIQVLAENNISILDQYSKSIEELPTDFLNKLDFVITLCAEEICPYLPTQAKRLHWPMPDPADASVQSNEQAFRHVFDLLSEKILNLAHHLKY